MVKLLCETVENLGGRGEYAVFPAEDIELPPNPDRRQFDDQ
ncbi:hypothetical protein SDC9_77692 [bioreactor metagenome]|uniref:Uncharacterized protein n=1 Tax=bioreactor metagenome TaxID=1076179 RepID=A0A644YS38_9ZZZZ